MSIDLNWATLTSGEDGAALAEQIRAFIDDRFQQVTLPKFVRSVQVHTFDFGTVAPDLEVKDVCDPLPDFYEEDEDDEDAYQNEEEEEAEEGGSRGERMIGITNENRGKDIARFEDDRRSRYSRSLQDDVPAHRLNVPGEASRPTGPSGPQLQTHGLSSRSSNFPYAPCSPALDSPNPFLASRSHTPGIPGGTSNLSYFHLPLSAGLSGTTTPLAAVAGSHLPSNQQYPYPRSPLAPPHPPSFPASPLPPPPEQIIPPSPPENDNNTDNDIQTILHLRYSGDIRLTLTADIQLDYPMSSFVGIPLQLTVTGLSFDGVAILAYIRRNAASTGNGGMQGDDDKREKLCFCFLNKDDASAVVGGDTTSVNIGLDNKYDIASASANTTTPAEKPGGEGEDAGVGALFTNIKVESEIGRRGDSTPATPTPGFATGTGTTAASSSNTSSNKSKTQEPSDVHNGSTAPQQQPFIHQQAQAMTTQPSQQPVLKNVGKVEKFVLEQVRRIFEDELVYPSFWSFLL